MPIDYINVSGLAEQQQQTNKRGGNNKYNMKEYLWIPYFDRVNNSCEELRELKGKKTAQFYKKRYKLKNMFLGHENYQQDWARGWGGERRIKKEEEKRKTLKDGEQRKRSGKWVEMERERAFTQMGTRAGKHGYYHSLPWKMS